MKVIHLSITKLQPIIAIIRENSITDLQFKVIHESLKHNIHEDPDLKDVVSKYKVKQFICNKNISID
jgi:hypothetical protein